MSNTLRVILDGSSRSSRSSRSRLDRTREVALEALYRTAAQSVIPPSRASSLRLVFRNEAQGTTIEPFLGSAAFDALLGIAKKRADTLALLAALVASSFSFSKEVTVLFARDGGPPPDARTELSLEAFRALSKLEQGRYCIVAPPRSVTRDGDCP